VVLKSASILVLAGLLLAGCGKSIPLISSPTDGQKIVLDQTPQFAVVMADNEYANTTIEIRLAEQLRTDLTCIPGNQSQAYCTRVQQQGYFGNTQTCIEGSACLITIIARRGDQTDVKTVNVIRTAGAPGAPPPR
jgi:hypothetical protein